MGDSRPPIKAPEVVKDWLVCYLSRQTDVLGSNFVSSRAHQGATPMGRSSGDMCHTVFAGSRQEVPGGFCGVRQHHRSASKDRAKEYLQPPVAANVVEGTPDGLVPQWVAGLDRR